MILTVDVPDELQAALEARAAALGVSVDATPVVPDEAAPWKNPLRREMRFEDWLKRKKLCVRLLQPHLPVCGSEIASLLHRIAELHFPEATSLPAIFFGRTPTLAHIEHLGEEGESSIWIHDALNDPATPEYVFSYVLKHELLHRRILPREVDGKRRAHPPEFREEEARIAGAEMQQAWRWIYGNFFPALKTDHEWECIWVNNRRMRELLYHRGSSEVNSRLLQSGSKLRPGELRFGFREEALRDFDPKPGG